MGYLNNLYKIFKGTVAGDGTGTPARTAAQGLNDNADAIDNALAAIDTAAEKKVNKVPNLDAVNDTTYPTSKAVKDYSDGKEIAANNFTSSQLGSYQAKSEKGIANGYMGLDANGFANPANLPGTVPEIIEGEYINTTTFNDDLGSPVTPEKAKIYMDVVVNPVKQYRWGGSKFGEINPNVGLTDDLAEGTTNLYFSGARVLATVLAGLDTLTALAVNSGDTILVGIGKLQAQFNTISTSIGNKLDKGTYTGNAGDLKSLIDAKETTIGAQAKADTAETNAKAYADTLLKETIAGRYATYAAMIADQVNQVSKGVYAVADASGFSTVDAGYADFEYLGTTLGTEADYRKLSEEESMDIVSGSSFKTDLEAAGTKAAPIDADLFGYLNSAAANALVKFTWANIKAALKTYFDSLYQAVLVSGTNIKTINNTSILGSGNLVIAGGGGGTTTDVLVTDNLQSIIDTANAGDYIRITPGVHEYGINNNGQTQNAILYIGKPLSIEIMAGATIKLADGTIPLETVGEITINQGVAKDLDDMTIGATSNFTGTTKIDYYIEIDGVGTPNSFKWGVFGEDNSYTLKFSGVAITGGEQTLENGVKIKFGSTTGHNINSLWFVSYDGQEHYGIRVGSGFHTNYIEDVKIFGEGIIDLNRANNVQPSLLVANTSSCVLIHGRVRRCFVNNITMKNAHRTLMAFGDHTGVYSNGGAVEGGESFDAEYIDIIDTKNYNYAIGDAGIELGHPMHRGLLRFVRCNGNYIEAKNTQIECNYLLREYEVLNNTLKSYSTFPAIHCWRRSDNGLIMGNILLDDDTAAKVVVVTGAPGGWDTAKNVTKINNYNLNAGNVKPYPPTVIVPSTANDSATEGLFANYPLLTNSNDAVGTLNGVDTSITYSSKAVFNGGTSKIVLPDDNLFSFTNGSNDTAFTISLRVVFSDTGSGFLVNKVSNTTTQSEWAFAFSSNILYIDLFSGGAYATYIRRQIVSFAPVVAQEYKFTVTYDGTGTANGLKLYVDGALSGTTVVQGTYVGMTNTVAPITLGKTGWTDAHQHNGSIKSLRFYNNEKSQAGVTAINAL